MYTERYFEVVAYLPADTLSQLERQMQALPDRTKEVVQAIAQGSLKDPLFKDPQFPLHALRALKTNQIDGLDFTTSQLFHNAMRLNKVYLAVPLFDGNEPHPIALEMVRETAQKTTNGHFALTAEKINIFFEKCRSLSALQQQFIFVMEPEKKVTIAQAIRGIGLNALLNFGPLRVLPSKGMMQAYLSARSEALAPKMVTRFQLSTYDALREQIPLNRRDFCLNFAPLSQVTNADGFEALLETNETEFHDFYHANVFLNVPHLDRIRLYTVSLIFKDMTCAGAEKTSNRLADMEHRSYAIIDPDEAFWRSIARSIKEDNKHLVKALAKALADNNSIGIEPLSSISHCNFSRIEFRPPGDKSMPFNQFALLFFYYFFERSFKNKSYEFINNISCDSALDFLTINERQKFCIISRT